MMKIGLVDCDKTNFPNLALMKISAWHKNNGDTVEWAFPISRYDRVYVSKVFGDEYTQEDMTAYQANEVYFGGSGYAIKVEKGKEVYHKELDKDLPPEIEHIYPDYSLYPELTKDTAFGFLTRGCPRACHFCIVSCKEGRASRKVADLSEFWRGQKFIKLLDPNILACKEHLDLLKQLSDSGASVDFTQGIDARLITDKNIKALTAVRVSGMHFAFDYIENEKAILKGLKIYSENVDIKKQSDRHKAVYILTNYNTTFEQDWYRVSKVRELGFAPYVMIYRKNTAPKITRYLQRWSNNRILYNATDFMDFVPTSSGKTIKELLKEYENGKDKD